MPIVDRQIAWKTARMFIPVTAFQGVKISAAGLYPISVSQGTPIFGQASSAEIMVVPMATADELQHIMPIPWNMDRDEPVRARVHFEHAAAAADAGITWKVHSLFYQDGDALKEVVGNSDTSAAFATHTATATARSYERTDWNDINWDDVIDEDDSLVGIALELDSAGAAAADECKLLGLELNWTVKATDAQRLTTSTEDKTKV